MTIGVLLDTPFDHGMRVLRGVQEYAERVTSWHVLPLHSTQEGLLAELLRRCHLSGVIAPVVSDRWVEGLPGPRVPVVNVSGASDIRSVPSVVADDPAVGTLAARHFLDNGWRNLACVASLGSLAAGRRREGFMVTAAAAGASVLCPPLLDSYAPDASWPTWLDGLTRPCGVFCTSDYVARRLVRHIRGRGWRIPEDIAVVGVGDSSLDGVLAGVELSSVALPGRTMGYRAAHRLAAALEGSETPVAVERIAPEQLVVRASSAIALGHGPIVGRALAWIQQHLAAPMDVTELARHVGASRRTLELHFRRELGHGPATEQRRQRLLTAQRMLRDSRLSLESVSEATGFSSASHLSHAFLLATGKTPGAWRNENRRTS